MSIRPISRVGSATTTALRGTSGVGGADALLRAVLDHQGTAARAGVASSSALGETGQAGSTTRTQGVSFAQVLSAQSNPVDPAALAEAQAREARQREVLVQLADERDATAERHSEHLRACLEEALHVGGAVHVGTAQAQASQVARPRVRGLLRAPDETWSHTGLIQGGDSTGT